MTLITSKKRNTYKTLQSKDWIRVIEAQYGRMLCFHSKRKKNNSFCEQKSRKFVFFTTFINVNIQLYSRNISHIPPVYYPFQDILIIFMREFDF